MVHTILHLSFFSGGSLVSRQTSVPEDLGHMVWGLFSLLRPSLTRFWEVAWC